MYIFGGLHNSTTVLNDIWRLDLDASVQIQAAAWTRLSKYVSLMRIQFVHSMRLLLCRFLVGQLNFFNDTVDCFKHCVANQCVQPEIAHHLSLP